MGKTHSEKMAKWEMRDWEVGRKGGRGLCDDACVCVCVCVCVYVCGKGGCRKSKGQTGRGGQ